MRGRREYTVEGAQPQAEFEEYGKGKLVGIERTVSLSGVINMFVLALDEVHTTVRVNVRYVAQKRNVVHDRRRNRRSCRSRRSVVHSCF